jgi:16S rRNA (cytosine967-C5)-methyltransferase
MDKAREAAAKILQEVHTKGAYANVALARALRRTEFSAVDRRFVTELVYGAVKAGDTLDWILRCYVNRPLKKIVPMVQEILRIGLYQIFYMDKVPASAACNEAVELTKKYSHAGTVKFVNAVLRTAVREPEKAKFPEGKGKATAYLALSSQHPQWLVKRWIHQFGYDEAAKLCAFDNEPAVLSLRVNTLKTTRDKMLSLLQEAGNEATPSALAPEGIICRSHGALDELAPLQQGLLQVQDESSMQVAHVVDPQPGEFIIDACSAPGGKATHMAALMADKGRVLACDIYDHKIARIRENAERLGLSCIEACLLDARELGKVYPAQADRVLVDAPCSGLGVLRRKPDARWNKDEAALRELPKLQMEILCSAAAAVRLGGVLVYSTCTIMPEENEAVVQEFLAAHPEFSLETTGHFLPTEQREESMVQLLPQREGTDGFFIVRMRKEKTE